MKWREKFNFEFGFLMDTGYGSLILIFHIFDVWCSSFEVFMVRGNDIFWKGLREMDMWGGWGMTIYLLETKNWLDLLGECLVFITILPSLRFEFLASYSIPHTKNKKPKCHDHAISAATLSHPSLKFVFLRKSKVILQF